MLNEDRGPIQHSEFTISTFNIAFLTGYFPKVSAYAPIQLRSRSRYHVAMQNNRLFAIALALLALILFLTDIRYDSPKPRPGDVELDQFSAERARPILEELLTENVPHPVGSPANAVVRDRILERLNRMGYVPQVQTAFDCARHGGCAQVENILARLPGTEKGRAVLLSVHYDSVWAGPGASDDMMGVAAALEIARILKESSALRHDVIFLINDGEEAGLHGARAFAEKHPWAAEVAAAVNVEARGTSGASLMFETNPGNRKMVSLASRALPRPATNSIYYTIYTLLPNDTDFTVYKAHDWPGVNFGIVGDAARYHTPADNFALASPGSLQHHGDNALAMVRALADSDLDLSAESDSVFFDVFTLFVVRWPASLTLVLAILGALLIVAVSVMRIRQGVMRAMDLGWGIAGLLGVVVTSALLGFGLHKLLAALGTWPTDWVAIPAPSLVVFWVIPFGVVTAGAKLLRDRNADGLWAGTWIVWSLLAIGVAATYPGISYLFVVPVLVAGTIALFGTVRKASPGFAVASLLGALAAGVVFFPVAWLLYDGMGTPIFPALTLVVALSASMLLPLSAAAHPLHSRLLAIAAIVAVIAGSVAAWSLPKATEENPAPLSFTLYHDASRQTSRWVINRDGRALPEALAATGFTTTAEPAYPWEPDQRPFVLEVTSTTRPEPPSIEIIERRETADGHVVRFRLRSPRRAPRAGIFVPVERTVSAVVQGAPVPPRPSGASPLRQPWRSYLVTTMPVEGVEMEIAFTGREPVDAFLWDAMPLTAAEGEAMFRERPSTHAPIGAGDRSVVSLGVVLE